MKTKHLDSVKQYLSNSTGLPTDHLIREKELSAYIEKEIRALPPKMRQIFEMSRKDNLSYQEIAEQLNVSENNVFKQVNNALRVLRTIGHPDICVLPDHVLVTRPGLAPSYRDCAHGT